MDVKQECQKLYDEAVAKVEAEATERKVPAEEIVKSHGYFEQYKPGLANLRLAISEVPEYRENYKRRKAGIIALFGSSANDELFLSKFAEAVKVKNFAIFFDQFVKIAFLPE